MKQKKNVLENQWSEAEKVSERMTSKEFNEKVYRINVEAIAVGASIALAALGAVGLAAVGSALKKYDVGSGSSIPALAEIEDDTESNETHDETTE